MNKLGGQTKENRAEEEMQFSATLFTINLTFSGLGLSPGLRGEI